MCLPIALQVQQSLLAYAPTSYPLAPLPKTTPVSPLPTEADTLASHENPSGGTLVLGHTSLLTAFLLTPDETHIITADRDEHIRASLFPQGYTIESFCLGHKRYFPFPLAAAQD